MSLCYTPDEHVNIPDKRWEPVDKGKGLAPVPPELAVLAELEETEIHPGNEESELNDDVGILTENDGEDIGNEKVDSRQILFARCFR